MSVLSLFSGYGGLDIAVTEVLDATVIAHCELDPAASAVLAHHWPTVPNLGDVTAVDWSTVEPADIITAGFPCQDISSAGKRTGIEGARSGLWRHVADAVRVLRPRLVVLENVAAILVRGLDRVLADLAGVGYDVRWTCLRASDVGAPHRRNRWWAVAYPSDASGPGWGRHEPERVGTNGGPADGAGKAEPGRRDRGSTHSGSISVRNQPEPVTERRRPPIAGLDYGTSSDPSSTGREPREGLGGSAWTTVVRNGAPATADTDSPTHGTQQHREPSQREADHQRPRLDALGRVLDWGQYEPAVRRWESILGRPAPEPTVVGRRGGQQLNPAFVEWMMGVPSHITTVPGLSRNDILRLAGNGVLPQQGAAALRWLLAHPLPHPGLSPAGQLRPPSQPGTPSPVAGGGP